MDILNTVSLESNRPIKINYYPLFVYDGLTGDLIKAQLQDGTGISDMCSSVLF